MLPWYFFKFISQYWNFVANMTWRRNKITPLAHSIKRKVLNIRHSHLQSRAILFVFLMLLIFSGAFAFDHYVTKTSNTGQLNDLELSKKFFSKVTILTIILLLNFFINELHYFAYKPTDVYRHFPNNPSFYIFLFGILVLTFGLLVLNSDFIPEIDLFAGLNTRHFKLHYKFYDGDIGTSVLLAINGFYAFFNILMDTSWVSYLSLFAVLITSLAMNAKIVKVWIIYAVITLMMFNNMQFVNNMKIGILKTHV